jgi:coronin-7
MLVGRGESNVLFYSLEDPAVPMFLNKQILSSSITNAFAVLPKLSVDVTSIEIIKGLRITNNCIETVSVTVPRVKKEFFQDDIFVPTIDFERSVLSIEEFWKGKQLTFVQQSMCPKNMTPVSQFQAEAPQRKVMPTFEQVISEEERKDASLKAMFQTAAKESEGPLKQDLMEGVADDEWD